MDMRAISPPKLRSEKPTRLIVQDTLTSESTNVEAQRWGRVPEIADRKLDTTDTKDIHDQLRKKEERNYRSPNICVSEGNSPPAHRSLEPFPYEDPSARLQSGAAHESALVVMISIRQPF